MLEQLKNEMNYTRTENGALTYASSMNSCLDLFSGIGAFRNVPEEKIITDMETFAAQFGSLADKTSEEIRKFYSDYNSQFSDFLDEYKKTLEELDKLKNEPLDLKSAEKLYEKDLTHTYQNIKYEGGAQVEVKTGEAGIGNGAGGTENGGMTARQYRCK